jgi:SAM-dependent methyltransferase
MDECALYQDPELYDLMFSAGQRERAIAAERFYVEEAGRNRGRVLELACGTGRLTIPIAQSGVEIVGADLSSSMLAQAREKAAAAGVAIQFVEADMRRSNLAGRFATILIAGNSLLHMLTIEELRCCLGGVRRHLAPGGRLVFDVSKWDLTRLARDPDERHPVFRAQHPSRGEIAIEETAAYDSAAQIRYMRWYLSAPGAADFRVIEYSLRVIFPQELPLLLESAGFRLEERYGEFPRQPFDASSPRQVCICAAMPR